MGNNVSADEPMKPVFNSVTRCWLLLLLATAGIAQAQEGLAYRVAGTIAMDEQRAVAMIESSAGTQALYRVGDSVDGWKISRIGQSEVVFSKSGQSFTLPLEGKMMTLAAASEEPSLRVEDIQTGTVELEFSAAFEQLQRLEKRVNAGDIVLTRAAVNRALGMPESAVIHQVDGKSTATPTEVMQLAMVALATGYATRLGLSADESKTVYLMPSGEASQ